MIRIDRLYKTLGGQSILHDVSLTVREREIMVVIGPSGTGKSVLLKHIIGLMEPDSGDVLVDQRSITRAGSAELSEMRRSMGYVFQDAALLDSLSVLENLRLALSDRDCRRDRSLAGTRVHEAITMVNLDESVLHRLPNELSGGMRKRVGVARAIINQPRVILYDEPSTGLDPKNVATINRLVLKNRDQLGATSVVVTHDMASIRQIADRVALLADGGVRFLGSPEELFTCADPFVQEFIEHSKKEIK